MRTNAFQLSAVALSFYLVTVAFAGTKLYRDRICHCADGCPTLNCASNYVGRGNFRWGIFESADNMYPVWQGLPGECPPPANLATSRFSRVWHQPPWTGKGQATSDVHVIWCGSCPPLSGWMISEFYFYDTSGYRATNYHRYTNFWSSVANDQWWWWDCIHDALPRCTAKTPLEWGVQYKPDTLLYSAYLSEDDGYSFCGLVFNTTNIFEHVRTNFTEITRRRATVYLEYGTAGTNVPVYWHWP